jgi:DNA replication protein DnaC
MAKHYTVENGVRIYDFRKTFIYLNAYGKYKLGESFNLKNEDAFIIYKLVIYSIRDQENCDKLGIDLNKGILLNGPVGCGKTSLMTLLKQFMYLDMNYLIKSTRDISAEYNIEGYSTILKYGKSTKIYCLDDLGVEQNVKHFGNECNTIAEILLHRYELLQSQNIVTHATTNLNANELEKIYGNRVRSRLRSMFNLIDFPNTTNDKRK